MYSMYVCALWAREHLWWDAQPMLKCKHTHTALHTQTHCSHLCVCDRRCQELLLSCAALLAGESVSWAKHTHTVTHTDIQKHTKHTYVMATSTSLRKIKSPCWNISKKRRAQLFTRSSLWVYSMQLHSLSMYLAILFRCVCVCACVCFRWQRVHSIPNAPVSLLSRTRSDQVFVTKLQQHETKQNACSVSAYTGAEETYGETTGRQR